jgi:hypothetical protein
VGPQAGGRAEAAALGHDLDRQVGGLQQPLGVEHPLPGQPLHRRRARRRPEPPGEGPRADVRLAGHLLDRDGLVEVLDGPVEGAADRVVLRGDGQRGVDELGLAAVALGRHDHPAGEGVGHLGAVVDADQVQAQVDARRGAGGRVDAVAGVDEQHVGVDLDGGVPLGELGGVYPVGRGAAPVEEAGLGQQEGAGAHAHDPAAPLVDRSHVVEHLRRGLVGFRRPHRDDQRVDVVEVVEPERRVDRPAAVGHPDRTGGRGDDAELVPRVGVLRAVEAENFVDDPQLERGNLLVDQGGHDVAPHLTPGPVPSFCERHGTMMAGILRICAVLPLDGTRSSTEDEYMFSVQCPRHGSEVLLSERRIVGFDNSRGRITVRWVCWCGHHGSHVTGRGRRALEPID